MSEVANSQNQVVDMPAETAEGQDAGHMDQAMTNLSELARAVDEIEQMVAVVKDISTKTDLLALNASIEAARAGQSGKGFAVVADEVGRLSEKAQKSIESVSKACDRLRSCSDSVASAMKKCARKINIAA